MNLFTVSGARPDLQTRRAQISRLAKSPIALLSVWAVGSTILGRSFTALVPGTDDARLFAYFGTQWLHGRIPYLQMWDNKPPGIFALDAAVFSVFPGSFTALAVVEGIFILGCITTIYLLMRRWGAPRHVACLAAGATAIASNLNAFNRNGNLTEIYVLWPAALSMYFFPLHGERSANRSVLAAGFFSGVAFLFKTVGLAPLLAQSALLLILGGLRRIRFRHAVRLIGIDLTGALLATLPFAAYFWKYHALLQMISASLTYDIRYGVASQTHLFSEPFIVASRLAPVGSLVACFLAGLVWFSASKWRALGVRQFGQDKLDFFMPLTLLWVLADLCGALAGGRNYHHYFLCLIPSLSVGAGLAYWFVTDKIRTETAGAANTVILILVLGPLLFPQAQDVLRLRDALYTSSASLPSQNPEELVAAYLNKVRKPGDTLFIWNYLPMIYFETEMPSPTVLPDAHYLRDCRNCREMFGPELLNQLKSSPPNFIVDGTPHPSSIAARHPNSTYASFYEFVEEHYDMSYAVNFHAPSRLRVYRRRAGAVP